MLKEIFNQIINSKSLIDEEISSLQEVLITFPDNKFGNIIIMAGGAGSGKGFVLDKLIGLQGKVFDVDKLKLNSMQAKTIKDKIQKEYGEDISKFNLGNPDDVGKLHKYISNIGLETRLKDTFFKSVFFAPKDRKPNLIFDVTLSSPAKLASLLDGIEELGYEKHKIHIVWVVNKLSVARNQNDNRLRKVPDAILVGTHEGAANTMATLLNGSEVLRKYMDGKIVFAFNQIFVDSSLEKTGRGGETVTRAEYVTVKEIRKSPLSLKELDKDLRNKVASYVPKSVSDIWLAK